MAAKEVLLNVCRSGSDDRISPFKVAVLVLVREYCSARLVQLGLTSNTVSVYDANAPFTAQQCKDFCLLSLELVQCYDLAWEEFELILEPGLYNLSRVVVDEFFIHLNQIVKDGPSGLLDLGESLEKLLMEPTKGKPMIRRDSVLGIFIRKMVLQMDRMSFEATVELSNNMVNYLDKRKLIEDPLELVQVSRKQAELLVSQQLTMLQRNESLAHSPVNLQKIIDRILQENKDFAEANYLAHLNEMRCQDFGQAEKKLHQAYDKGTISMEGLIYSKLEENLINNKSFRHASLNMASLHSAFGHKDLAFTALNETVALSGEAADHVLLQESLAWFCHLEQDPVQRLKMIERLISKSSESSLYYLASLGLAMWTQDCAVGGSGIVVEPARIFEYLHAGDVANCQHSLTDMSITTLALRAALWHFYGYPQNALQVSQLILTLHTGDPTKGNIYYNNETVHGAVCNVALHLARNGLYNEAECVTRFAAGQYAHFQQRSTLWKLTDLHVAFYRTLWLGQWDRAELIVSQLAVFDKLESLAKSAHLLLSKGDTSQGSIVLDALEEKFSVEKSVDSKSNNRLFNPGWNMGQMLRLRVQSLMLRAVLLSSRHNFAQALDHISQASDICSRHHMGVQLALVSLQSAEIQLHMNYTANAILLVRKHLNTICTHGSLLEQGLALFLLARSLMSEINNIDSNKTEIIRLFSRAKNIFDKIEAFHLVKDVVFLEAVLYDRLGLEKERNRQAMVFKQLDEQYPLQTSNGILLFIGI